MTRYALALAACLFAASAYAQGADYDTRVFTGATSDALEVEVCTTTVQAARSLGTSEYLEGAKKLHAENRGANTCWLSIDDPTSVVSTDANPGYKMAADKEREFLINGTRFGPRVKFICENVQASGNCMVLQWQK